MKDKIILLFIIIICLITIFIKIDIPKNRVFQIDYIQDSIEHHLFLQTLETNPNCFEVSVQEWCDTICPITIIRIFDYETF